jgi:transcriptional regulator with XRE-family HTH domain
MNGPCPRASVIFQLDSIIFHTIISIYDKLEIVVTQIKNSFGHRIRELLEQRGLTIAELAERAELAPSFVSKLLTETDTARREPRLEHVLSIARALELPSRELVLGTHAESLLDDWVPRAEFEVESIARTRAQSEAATLRTELAGVRSEAKMLQSTVDQLSRELATATQQCAEVEAAARRKQAKIQIAREAAEAMLASALAERDRALELARNNYQAWVNARSWVLQLQREVSDARGSATVGWITALIGTVGGAIIGAAAAEPPHSATVARGRKGLRRRRS